ncbi:endolytic transglycosylase MltG, partial [bacterium]|nr:endolytic transglycosylase MltG [bacterium]
RLRIRMKLDCDPTIIYAIKEEEGFNGNLRKRDLKFDSPYNTYLYRGLPPGPIANPGKGSLRAALFPADNNFIYFVSKNDGSHYFSSSFREHQNAVNRYQRRH